jgi:hypothetical protein
VTVYDFLGRTTTVHDPASIAGASAAEGHGGGDAALMDAFVAAVASGDASLILSGAQQSLNSHLATFGAERARREGTVVTVER